MASGPEPQNAQHPRTRKRRGSINGCGNNRRPGTATTRDRFRVRVSAFLPRGSGPAPVTGADACCALLGLPSGSCPYPDDPHRSRGRISLMCDDVAVTPAVTRRGAARAPLASVEQSAIPCG